jgi:hypothetical protein
MLQRLKPRTLIKISAAWFSCSETEWITLKCRTSPCWAGCSLQALYVPRTEILLQTLTLMRAAKVVTSSHDILQTLAIFHRSKIEFVGSDPTRGMDIYNFSVFVFTCICRGFLITEELFEWKSSGSGSRKQRLTATEIRCADHATPSTCIRKSWH